MAEAAGHKFGQFVIGTAKVGTHHHLPEIIQTQLSDLSEKGWEDDVIWDVVFLWRPDWKKKMSRISLWK